MKCPVLMYHEITDRPAAKIPVEELPYAITNATFDEQLAHLARNGFICTTITAESDDQAKNVVITFDDGHSSDSIRALPKLLEHGYRAEFYITTGWIGTPGYVSRADIRELSDAGMVLGTHGVDHSYFDEMSDSLFEQEILNSKAELEDIVGHEIVCGSAPGGRLHRRTLELAPKHGYRYLCGSTTGLADLTPSTDFRLIPRFAIRRDMTHGQFVQLISASRRTLFMQSMKSMTLNCAKSLLGNRNYEAIRHKILSNKNSS